MNVSALDAPALNLVPYVHFSKAKKKECIEAL